MAVKLNLADLQFILRQIKIAEANSTAHNGTDAVDLRQVYVDAAGNTMDASGAAYSPATHPGLALTLAISDPHVPYGLRTVDGTYNNVVPGRELWGSSGQPMPQLFNPHFVNDADGDSIRLGPGAPPFVNGNYGGPGSVVDADPRTISNLVVDQSLNNPAAIAAALKVAGSENVIADQRAITTAFEALKAARATEPNGDHSALKTALDTLLEEKGVTVTNGSIDILNVSPDEGLSKPFNAWMTFFGQFFDHGLDLISKGGNGSVYIPLQADDPLVLGADGVANTADDLAPHLRFMVLTRATGVEGSQRNVTTPFVDQNQTYTSNASHQVFLREYQMVGGKPVATGRLLGHTNPDGSHSGLATWADVKHQAKTMLGIDLSDADVGAVPQLLVDAYGEFVRGANGLPQVMTGVTAGGQATYVEGSLASPINLTAIGAARTFNAFLDDIAHNAAPVLVGGVLQPDADADTGNEVPVSPQGRNLAYDNELLDQHFVTGDGRGNENIGLTTVHHIFHSEHNRQVDAQKLTILQTGDLAFINEWLAADIDRLPTGFAQMTPLQQLAVANGYAWDGERLFQAARFATEMQYQHLVFEEFARKIQPLVDPFVFNSVTELDPSIFAEFANTVYRFGHSMLTENMPRLGADGEPMDTDLGLIEAFLNPVRFDNGGAISHDAGAAAIMRGMTIERGAEIDEFVVGALRNNLLGLPLDLAAINIARGRDTGTPSLNEARAQLFAATNSTFLTPYTSWAEMAANLKNPLSIVNFIAAYGTHESITSATTLADKREAAMLLVFGGPGADVPADRLDFVNHRGSWAGRATGFEDVDLWIGGLAEKQMPFGGMLGSTFNAIFEAQMENLQDADRFYYLTRVQGQNFLNELEQNSFSKIMLANSDLSLPGPDGIRGTADDIVPRHIGVDAFADYDFELEVNFDNQLDQNGAETGKDPTGNDPVLEAMGRGKVMRDDPGTSAAEQNYIRFTGGEHVLVGGTDGRDTIITDYGDDGIWGDAGNDRIESGAGVDLVNGGAGDDIITDSGDSGDFLKGEDGNDVIANSNGIDILMGGRGKDAVFVGVDATEVFGGEGDDFILGGADADLLMGNEGNDWIEAGDGFDTTAGDNSELFFNSAILGHDVMFAGGDEHDFDGESGDDIMVQGESVMRNEGMFGFDWAIFKGVERDAHADMNVPIFTTEQQDILRNRFDKTEALSGWKHDDTLIGDSRVATGAADPEEPAGGALNATNEGVFFNDGLSQAGIDRIAGLRALLGNLVAGRPANATAAQLEATIAFDKGNILLGGAGSDTLQGNGGDDLLDGDSWLNVRISIRDAGGTQIATVDSLKHQFPAGATGIPAGWAGKSLFELMIAGTVNPSQLHIVREVLTTGATTADVDTAVFSDVRANYTITRGANNVLTVTHVTQSNPAVDDGTDTLRNMEKLRFADGTVDVALILAQPFNRLNIVPGNVDTGTFTAQFVSTSGATLTQPPTGVTIQWQVLDANGQWRNAVAPQDGTFSEQSQGNRGFRTFNPSDALAGSEFRVVANWTAAGFGPQTTASVETGISGTVNDDDLLGSTRPNVVLGLAGDDDIEGDAGNDLIDGGEGDDVLRGNDGADTLIGRTGDNTLDGGNDDDELSGGHGNDLLIGGAGTDTAIFSGPIAAYGFERNAQGLVVVSDTLGAEGDGLDTLNGIELIQMGEGALPYTLGANGSAGLDIVVGTAGANTLSGGAGDDLVFAGAGNDSVLWRPGDGRDFVDGGAGTDAFRILDGTFPVQQLTLAQARADARFSGTSFRDDTQTVVVRNNAVIAELKNVEEVRVNTLATGAPVVVDPTPTNGAVSPTEGQPLTSTVASIQDTDGLGTFSYRWQQSDDGGQTWVDIAGNAAGQPGFTPGQAQVGDILRLRVSFTDGRGNPEELFSAPTGVVGDNFTGTPLFGTNFNGTAGDDVANGADGTFASGDTMNGNAGNDVLNGRGGNDAINGGAGNDRINGGNQNDTITQVSTDGRDFVDGGANTDTYQLNGVAGPEVFRIYSRTAWLGVAGNTAAQLDANTEIVVTRGGTGAASIVAELDNIEEIRVNTLAVTTPGGAGGGANGGDTIQVIGSFAGTSLNFNTITIDGNAGNDTVDISALASAHRIVFRSNGGSDTIVGPMRPQDVIELPAGSNPASFTATTGANGMTTLSNGSHSVTFSSAGGMPRVRAAAGDGEAGGNDGGDGVTGAFGYTARDIAGLKDLLQGRNPDGGDDDVPTGVRELSGHGNNADHALWGNADQPFIRLTEARYGEPDADGNRAINPIFAGLDPRNISNILGAQEADLPKADNDGNIFFMAFGQYFDHGLDFLPKGGNGTIQIGAPGGGGRAGTGNPADLSRGTVHGYDADGVPLHLNKTSPFVDQNQAYGSHALVGQFLREGNGSGGLGSRLLAGGADPSNPDFKLLPTLRELIQHHWANDTMFEMPDGSEISFRTYYSAYPISDGVTGNLVDAQGAFDPQVVSKLAGNFMGSGHALLLDTNPFVSLLDHYVAGDGRANENVTLTSMHTIWARNHNWHVEKLAASGFAGTADELFQAAKMVNEAEYQRVVFDEFADALLGGMRGVGTHGFEDYDPDADPGISHEFAAAVYRVGHSLIGQNITILGPDGQPKQVPLFDAFLNPSNDPDVFTAPLPPGYVPAAGYEQLGVNSILGGIVRQPAEAVDFNIVDAVRNDLVRISADLFAFNVARGWDVGLGTLNQVRADLAASQNRFVAEAVGHAGGNLSPYASWEDFQARNGLSDAVIAQFKQAYPDLVLSGADIAAFAKVNPDIALADGPNGTKIVKGIDRVDLWVGGLAETHINGGMVGQTFWVVLHEQFDRLQEGDRFYYTTRFDGFDFYETFIDGQGFADIVMRNTGMTDLPEHIFQVDDEDDGEDTGGQPGDGDDDEDEDEDGTPTGENPDDDDDDEDGDGDEDDDGEEPGEDDDGTPSGEDDEDDGDGTGTPQTPEQPPLAAQPVVGTSAADVLRGTAAADVILGLDGDDVLSALGGADVAKGGAGSDVAMAGEGDDTVFGDGGDDTLFGEEGDDDLLGGAGDDFLGGGAGNDRIEAGAGNDRAYGGAGNDVFIATSGDGADMYWGDEGADTLDLSLVRTNLRIDMGNGLLAKGSVAVAGSPAEGDTFYGIENVIGGSGSDTIVASRAANEMDGGEGSDTFVFGSAAAADGDRLWNFQPGDRIDLSAMDADPQTAGRQAFSLGGTTFTGTAEVIVKYEDDHTLVMGDGDGDRVADFTITVDGTRELTASDFKLS